MSPWPGPVAFSVSSLSILACSFSETVALLLRTFKRLLALAVGHETVTPFSQYRLSALLAARSAPRRVHVDPLATN